MRSRYSYLVFLLACVFIFSSEAQQISDVDIDRIKRSTVFIMQVSSENLSVTCVGTGILVRYDGLIATNAHHVVQSERCPGDTLIIALSVDNDEPSVPRYRASIIQANVGLDLALLQITQQFDGRIIERDSLQALPFVELADSDLVEIDETITVIGYPDFGNSPVTEVRGTISAFIGEPSGGDRSWLKIRTSDASILPGTMSGGGAFDREGRLVGLMTSAPTPPDPDSGNCTTVEDTNADGFINSLDRCIPIGDFISVLRPSDVIRPLLRSASLGLTLELLTSPRFQVSGESSTPEITNLFFSPSVVNGQPTTVLQRVPAGAESLYLFFDYSGMTPETVYEVRVTIDGLPNQTFSLPPVRWSGGTSGLWYIGSGNQTRPNGRYEYRVFVDGLLAATASVVVGGPAEDAPQFSNITFGLLDEQGNLTGSGYVLPTGNIARASFIHRNLEPGTVWTQIWSLDGRPIPEARISAPWQDTGDINTETIPLQAVGGLLPGRYRLELYIDDFLSALGEFIVAGSQAGPLARVFSNVEFRQADSPLSDPTVSPARTYPDGVNTLYIYFDWEQIAPGTLWTLEWAVDGTVFYRQTSPWNAVETGEDFTMRLSAPGGLPDGTYTVSLLINDILLASEEVTVGIGQLPIDRFAQAQGIQLRGQIVDAETGLGIEGATFLLISEDYSVADFTWRRDQLYALAITDRNGRFEIDRPLQFDSPYSVLIEVEGYLPVAADGYEITAETLAEIGGSPIEMLIPLVRD